MQGYGVTDVGKLRKENQDYYLLELGVITGTDLVVVCDGMGGLRGGSVASSLASEVFAEEVKSRIAMGEEPVALLRAAVGAANESLYRRSEEDLDCQGMGTTLVGGIFTEHESILVNVGDSRAYLVRDGNINRLTRDHSLVEELVRAGEITRDQARTHPRRNLITRAIGIEPSVECDVFTPDIESGDTLLFCTDGLCSEFSDEELCELIESERDLKKCCELLVDMTLRRGAPDNVTVVMLRA